MNSISIISLELSYQ